MRLLSCQAALRIRIHYILSYPDLDPLFPKVDPRIRIHYTGKVDPRIWIHYSKLWIPGLCSLSIWKRKWEALINHVGGSPEYVVVFNQLHFFGSGSTISKAGFDYPDPLFRKGGSENLDPDQRQNGMVLICYIWTIHFLVQKNYR